MENMLRVASELLKITPNVIFATTTPVDIRNLHNNNETIIEYNAFVVPHLEKMGIIINDLHGLVYPRLDEYISSEDLIHLTEAGSRACAEQVAAKIREAAELLKK